MPSDTNGYPFGSVSVTSAVCDLSTELSSHSGIYEQNTNKSRQMAFDYSSITRISTPTQSELSLDLILNEDRNKKSGFNSTNLPVKTDTSESFVDSNFYESQSNQAEENKSTPILNMRFQNMLKFPKYVKKKNPAFNRRVSRLGMTLDPLLTVNLLRKCLQPSINREINSVIDRYMQEFFQIAFKNIETSFGSQSLVNLDVQKLQYDIMKNATSQYLNAPASFDTSDQSTNNKHQRSQFNEQPVKSLNYGKYTLKSSVLLRKATVRLKTKNEGVFPLSSRPFESSSGVKKMQFLNTSPQPGSFHSSSVKRRKPSLLDIKIPKIPPIITDQLENLYGNNCLSSTDSVEPSTIVDEISCPPSLAAYSGVAHENGTTSQSSSSSDCSPLANQLTCCQIIKPTKFPTFNYPKQRSKVRVKQLLVSNRQRKLIEPTYGVTPVACESLSNDVHQINESSADESNTHSSLQRSMMPILLNIDDEFVLGSVANLWLGMGATRGRIYTKYPWLFRYLCDTKDKIWLSSSGHLPNCGVKAFIMLSRQIRQLLNSKPSLKNNNQVPLVDFRLPLWLFNKVNKSISCQSPLPSLSLPSQKHSSMDVSVLNDACCNGNDKYLSVSSPKKIQMNDYVDPAHLSADVCAPNDNKSRVDSGTKFTKISNLEKHLPIHSVLYNSDQSSDLHETWQPNTPELEKCIISSN